MVWSVWEPDLYIVSGNDRYMWIKLVGKETTKSLISRFKMYIKREKKKGNKRPT